jgi:hypothetical protein
MRRDLTHVVRLILYSRDVRVGEPLAYHNGRATRSSVEVLRHVR